VPSPKWALLNKLQKKS